MWTGGVVDMVENVPEDTADSERAMQMSWREVTGQPMIFSVALKTLCIALLPQAEESVYHTLMQYANIVWMVVQ